MEADVDGVWEVERDSRPLLLVPMAAGPLRTRIRHILQLEDDPMLITPKSLAITLATLLTAATLAFVYLPKSGQAEQSTTENTEKRQEKSETKAAEPAPMPKEIPFRFLLKREASGQMQLYLNGGPVSDEKVLSVIAGRAKANRELRTSLVAEKDAPQDEVRRVAKLIQSLGVKYILSDPTPEEWSKWDWLFTVRNDNLMQTRTRDVHPAARESLPHAIEALQHDPYGPMLTFDANWNSDRSKLTISAPQAAQAWLELAVREVEVNETNVKARKAEQSATEATENTEKKSSEAAVADRYARSWDSTHSPDDDSSWLNDPNFGFPRDKQIAMKAWKMLGHKLVPAIPGELATARSVGYSGGLKDLSYRLAATHLRNKPTILVAVDDQHVRGFDDLDKVLAEISRLRTPRVDLSFLVEEAAPHVIVEPRPVPNGEKTVRELLAADSKFITTPMTPEDFAKHVKNQAIGDQAQQLVTESQNAANDPKLIRSLFQTSDTNPIETRSYEVSSDLRQRLSSEFEGWQFDPYGPQVSFDTAWANGDKTLTVRAPKAAHDKLFQPEIRRLSAQLTSQTTEQSTTEGTENTETNNAEETTQEPVKADDWPKGVAFPSPKEGEISKRAWKLFHVKVVPATDEELQQVLRRGKRGGLKLVDFDEFPHFEEPFILTDIGSKPISRGIVTFDDLAKVLDALEAHPAGSDDIIGLKGEAKNGHFQYNLRLPSPASAKASAKFPSLEDQKLADLAWKRLGLELEPIAADDLQRVKALGYDGGLTVAGFGSFTASQDGSSLQLSVGDTLVGLHVWPTTNLKDVATVLNRDDLAEFNPLKIYVVRKPLVGMGGTSTSDKGTVVAGRIYVPIGSDADQARLKDAEETTRQALEVASLSFESSMKFKQEAQAKLAKASANGDAAEAAQRAYDQAQKQFNEAKRALDDAQSQYKEIHRQLYFGKLGEQSAPAANNELMTASPSNPPTPARNTPSTWPSVPSTQYQRTVDRYNAGPSTTSPTPPTENSPALHSVLANPSNPQTNPSLAPRAAQLTPSSSPLAPQASLRYDGKPFEEWRNVWKTELSTEKRIEAVKALAAFGRAGYGQEATAAILDVAGEYDFLAMDDSPEGKLKQVVLDELTPESHEHSSAKFWIPVLANRLQGDSKKWKWLACNLLDRLRTDDKASLKIVQGLASIDDNSIRGSVIGAVVRGARTGKYPLDESTRKLIDQSLESKDPEMVRIALIYMVSYPPPGNALDSQPALPYKPTALPKLLFHADSEVRRQARRLLPLLDDKATTDLVDQLIAILKDPSRQRDRIDAIRAIGIVGKKAAKATPALADILKSSDDQPTLAATMVALARIADRRAENVIIQGVQPQFVKHNFGIELTNEESRTLQNRISGEDGTKQKEFLERLRQEEQQVPSLQNANRGGGVF